MTSSTHLFQGQLLPGDTMMAGWAALVSEFDLQVPVRGPSCISNAHVRNSIRQEAGWRIFDKRYGGKDNSVASHLTFAFKHESMDLLILKRFFEAVDPTIIEDFIKASPTGSVARRVWFLYEYLMQRTLDVPDAVATGAVPVLDPKMYMTVQGELSKRHRVRNNLLGTADYCPVIRLTEQLKQYMNEKLDQKAQQTVGQVSVQLVARAASFMLLADSKASFEIEGERPPRNRLERWGQAIKQSGKYPLNKDELCRLQAVLLGGARFTGLGLRQDGVFLGERGHDGEPLPEFIGARPEDLPSLIESLLEANERMSDHHVDAVVQAAVTAFGFVYIHPFEDGNGRLHRCLIHHVLAERKFSPPDLVFPVSSVMLDRIETYKHTLQNHSAALMPYINWMPTIKGNVSVTNETADLYRYWDGTEAAEFLYGCVKRTVEQDLPREIDYLKRHDAALNQIIHRIEMPDRMAEDLMLLIRQNGGKLSKKRREKAFARLTDEEVAWLEQTVTEAFEGFEDAPVSK